MCKSYSTLPHYNPGNVYSKASPIMVSRSYSQESEYWIKVLWNNHMLQKKLTSAAINSAPSLQMAHAVRKFRADKETNQQLCMPTNAVAREQPEGLPALGSMRQGVTKLPPALPPWLGLGVCSSSCCCSEQRPLRSVGKLSALQGWTRGSIWGPFPQASSLPSKAHFEGSRQAGGGASDRSSSPAMENVPLSSWPGQAGVASQNLPSRTIFA